uniref:Uncharacterized protein n=1 Tax=Tetraselmis sp. GSL018 TaxID=582737 RepID=A0A061RA72_9CHLO
MAPYGFVPKVDPQRKDKRK